MELSRVTYDPTHLQAATAAVAALGATAVTAVPLSAGAVNALLISLAIARDVAMVRPAAQAQGTPTMLPGQRVGTADIPVIGWTTPETVVAGTQNDAPDLRGQRKRAWHALTEQMFRIANAPPTAAPARSTGAAVAIETYVATPAPILLTEDVDRLLVPYYQANALEAPGLALPADVARAAVNPLADAMALDQAWTAHAARDQKRAGYAGAAVVGLAFVVGRLIK